MSEHIITITNDSFEQDVLNADLPVLVDFWAPWCAPCKIIAPILEEISNELQGRLIVAKLNVDDHPDPTSRYGIRGIPTLLVFKGGEVVATKVGSISKSELKALLADHI